MKQENMEWTNKIGFLFTKWPTKKGYSKQEIATVDHRHSQTWKANTGSSRRERGLQGPTGRCECVCVCYRYQYIGRTQT